MNRLEQSQHIAARKDTLARTWRNALGAALIAVAALAGTPMPASAQEITAFYKSTGGVSLTISYASGNGGLAQPVRTGEHPEGYTLTEVRLYVGSRHIADSSLSIWVYQTGAHVATLQYSETVNEAPSTLHASFTDLMEAAVYTAPPNTVLDPNTTYAFQINHPPSGVGAPILALRDADRYFSAAGIDWEWSVTDSYLRNNGQGQWVHSALNSRDYILRIAFYGYRNPSTSDQEDEADPPTVDGTPRVSGAGQDANWTVGETVDVTVAFSEAVDVDASDGTPSIGIGLGGPGGAARNAAYVSGSGTTELVFRYTLVADDGSHGTMAVTPNSLALNGGIIRSTESEADALLTHVGAAVQGRAGHSDGSQASFRDVPDSHDGETSFTVELRFSSPPPGLSAKRDAASVLEVTGGSVTQARETTGGESPAWEVTITPDGLGEVTVRLPVRACDTAHAVCIAGAPLSEAVEVTVPGPPLMVSIAAASAVTEGAAAEFALTRTGDTTRALTVTVQVAATGDVLAGEPPASATFEAGSDGATLSVATEDDEVSEDASTVTATVSPGEGYEIDGTAGSAELVVADDDTAPVVETASPLVVVENTTEVVTLAATDADTAFEDLSWSIPEGEAGGADGERFALTADGVLTFEAAKDFEAPDDSGADGDYEVTVRVTDGANPVDMALVVRLQDVDDTAPVLSSATVDGATLTLAFDEALAADSVPPTPSFAVRAGGTPRAVASLVVSGSTVRLTLSSAVQSGETVTVRYTVPETAALRDAAGNRVASFSATDAVNETVTVVSIRAASTPVVEGNAAAFVLRRTGTAAAALTVTIRVSAAGSVLTGTVPTSAAFAAGASETRLAVATANDSVDEADGRVSVSVVAGAGYDVDAVHAEAWVDVFDNELAPPAGAVTLWSSTLAWSDIGNNWFGGFTGAFSQPGWSEDGQDFRIWYIAYYARSRTLSMVHDGSGGLIADPGELTLHVGGLEVGPGATLAAFAQAGVATLGGVDNAWRVGERVTVRLFRTSSDTALPPAGPGVSVTDAAVAKASGTPLRFRVALDAPSASPVSVRYRTGDATARAGEDYVAARGAVRFAPGETVQTVEVAVMPDSHGESEETLLLTLSQPSPQHVRIDDEEATGTITATELPTVSIETSSPVSEGAVASFLLQRTGETAQALTVALEVTETGSVLSAEPPTSVTFVAGSASAALSVATEDDEVAEAASMVTATVSSGTSYTVDGTSGSAEVVVADDDAAPVVATASPIEIAENATEVATLSATDADTASEDLSWSIPEGEAGGADGEKFALTAHGVLTFEAAKDFEAPDDGDGDGDYEVTVRVTDGANPVDTALVVRLQDVDDTAPALSSATVDSATLTLAFDEPLDGNSVPPTSSFAVTAGGTAHAVASVAVSTSAVTLTLSSAVTAGETVTVGYTVPTGAGATPVQDATGNTAAAFADAEVTNETAALPVVSIVASATPVTEGAAATFTLARTGTTDATLTVTVSVSETEAALSGTPPTSLKFAAGSASATLSIATLDDEVVEAASTVTATVSSGAGYTVDESSGSAEVVVEDDDTAPVVATTSPIEVAENATAVATLAATDADTAVEELSWSIPDDAAGGADAAQFALTAEGVLTFNAVKDFEAPDDANGDGDYEVTVRITDGANPVDAALVIRLTDADDTAPVLAGATVDGATLTLTFGEALDEASAPAPATFAVTVGGSARTVEAAAISDSTVTLTLSSAVSSAETVTVGYTVPTEPEAAALRDAAGNRVASFADAPVTNATAAALPVVSIAPGATPVAEGEAAGFTLARTGDTAAELTVAVAVTETGGVLDEEPAASVAFAAGSASAELSVATEDDDVEEGASTVTVALSAGEGYEVDGAAGSAEVVVEDDDAAPVVETDSPIEVAENATAVATLTATDADTGAADLSWSIPEGEAGGADAAQFALTAEGVLTFGSAKDFEAPDDADGNGDYEVTVRVTDGANPADAALVIRLADADDAAPVLAGASVDGATLTLTFGEALDEGSAPPGSSFAVTVAGAARIVDSAAVSGSVVTLTLTSAVTAGETVTVGYTVPTGADAKPVKDAAGNPAAAFADAEVTNETAAGLPVVSIAPVATPVTEGTAAAFVLARTGATAAALTVAVSVGQAGSVLDGPPPSSATFEAGASQARLSVATVNDGAHEADARVRASVVAGEGYAVDGENASAGVDVLDDDAAPQVAAVVAELWSTTLVWADLGHGWYGGFADAFSAPGWSEDGQAYRIWYIAYDTGARELLMAHDGSGGLIGEPGELSLHVGGLAVGPGEALSEFARAGVGTLGGVDSHWPVGERVTVRLTRTAGDAQAPPAGPALSVADARVNESSGAPLRFRVTLDAPAQSTVSVRYRTSDGTARAGEDYAAAHGVVRFAPGETGKTVEVAVLPDSHDEGAGTMTLTLSRPYGATLADGAATGTISNTGPIPKAWIARFGRTVAEQAIDAVEARFAAPREAGLAGTLAGQPLGGFAEDAAPVDAQGEDTREGLETIAEWLDGTAEEDDEDGLGARTMSGRELLSTSSFSLTQGAAESGFASFWGRGVVTRFDGRDGERTLDGEVASAMVGADWSRDALLGGLMVSHSRGEGSYRDGSGAGTVESTLTALFPYARYALTERVSAWGMAGYGEGTLTLTPEGQAALRPDLSFLMGALGVRGVLVDGGADGATLAAKSDAFAVRTSTGAVSGRAGNLEASRADVTRVRFALEGSRPVRLGESAVLTPSLELGVRHDGGDAETGFGADLGAGLALSDPARGLSAELRARGLLTHEAQGMRERSVSGTLIFDPAPETERGLSLSLTQTVGAQGAGGAEALLERQSLAGLGAQDDNELSARRLDARIGYGFGVLDDRFTAVPELGLGLSDTDREVRLGWRLAERVAAGLAFELGVEGTRREWSDGEAGPQHGIGIGAGWRLVGRGAEAFEMRIEAARLDAANDDSPPENTIGLKLRARW